jgi:uncharacterized protein YciI
MPQFLYRLHPVRPEMLSGGMTEREEAIITRHFNYLKKLVGDGVVFMAGRTLTNDERTFGLVVFAAASEPEARDLMLNDPAVKDGVMKAELFPYQVALWSAKSPVAD